MDKQKNLKDEGNPTEYTINFKWTDCTKDSQDQQFPTGTSLNSGLICINNGGLMALQGNLRNKATSGFCVKRQDNCLIEAVRKQPIMQIHSQDFERALKSLKANDVNKTHLVF